MALAVVSSMLGTLGLQGYRLYHQSRVSEKIRVQAVAEAYACQFAPLVESRRDAQLASLVQELAWHDDSRLIAVYNPAGEPLAQRGAVQLIERYRQRMAQAGEVVWRAQISDQNLIPEFAVAAVPIVSNETGKSLGTVIYAMAHGNHGGAGGSEWLYFMCILGVGGIGMLLGFFWLKRAVLDPLSLLVRTGPTGSSAAVVPADGLPVHRGDEIGQLARLLSSLHVDLDEWRDRAARLERSIDDRVAHETDRITRELKNAQKKIWTDPLTRLGNRRLLDEKFAEIFQAQQRSDKELSIVMLDVDNFKQLNDSLGHPAGDDLLRFAGELLRQCLREQDLAVRYGGDEFVLILPSVSPDQARAISDRTIAMFAQQTRLLPVTIRPTMSAGIASLCSHHPASADALLQMADAALYQSKSSGKGCACVYTPGLQVGGAPNEDRGRGARPSRCATH